MCVNYKFYANYEVSQRMEKLVCVSDFKAAAIKILPQNSLEYFETGADDELTLKDNQSAFQRWLIRPRVLRDVSIRSTQVFILGKPLPFPLGVSPTGSQKMAHPQGEIANAKAAAAMGTIFTLSTASNCTIEEVAEATPGSRKWFQLYVYKNREYTAELIARAEKAGFEALVVTVDAPLLGKRRVNERTPFTMGPHIHFANVPPRGRDGVARNFDASLTWKDLAWFKRITKLPIIVKGILTAEDAKLAVEHGVAGIFVSNHGGRQLDTVPATIDVLPEIVQEVGGKCEIYLDGGVTTGTDIFKALALGANMVFSGRSLLWGLAVGGEEGAKKILEIYKQEFDLTMALAGVAGVGEISQNYVTRASHL